MREVRHYPDKALMNARELRLDSARTLPVVPRFRMEDFTVPVARASDKNLRVAAEAVAGLLVRHPVGPWPPGVALVTLVEDTTVVQSRVIHRALFEMVWSMFAVASGRGLSDVLKVEDAVSKDGSISVGTYGSEWSFKQPHQDRSGILFSHLFGPVGGFSGGHIIVIDGLHLMWSTQMNFADAFDWSDEQPTSKPVLKKELCESAAAASGYDFGVLDHSSILFVNNEPSSGMLHGASEIVVQPAVFVREIHRCVVRERPTTQR